MTSTEKPAKGTQKVLRFFIGSPALIASLAVGIVCGFLWSAHSDIAIWIFIALTLYTLVDEIISIVDSIRHGHVGSDILAVIAIVATTVVGQFWAAWIVDVMVFTGEAIETYAQSRATQNLNALMEAAPQSAHILRGGEDDSSSEATETVPVDQVKISDRLIVKPGETIPVDGVLLSEQATIDLSMINGEPVPVDVMAGHRLASGAINGSNALTMRATAAAGNSQYQKILDLVRSAEQSRADVVKAADALSVPFTIISLLIAFIAWYVAKTPLRFAQVLVLATPCPLLIAAPVAYMGGTGRLAKEGIIVKTQDVIENLGMVTHAFFDKTGTLTYKKPAVARVDITSSATSAWTADSVLRLAGPLEAYSAHILAKGIASAGDKLLRSADLPVPKVTGATENSGNGITGMIDGHDVKVGRLAYVTGNASVAATDYFPQATAANEMVTYVAIDGALTARIVLKDFARANSAESIAELKRLGVPAVTMVTGDHQASADAIAREVGIEDVRASLLPAEKLAIVSGAKDEKPQDVAASERWIQWFKGSAGRKAVTMMVGDGVNDAPVLAAADIGVAMTDGSSTAASESAQVVIMNDDIAMVPRAIVIARQTKRTMLQASIAGIAMAIVLMICAAFNLIPVVVGALLQEVIDSISIFWALTAILDKRTSTKDEKLV